MITYSEQPFCQLPFHWSSAVLMVAWPLHSVPLAAKAGDQQVERRLSHSGATAGPQSSTWQAIGPLAGSTFRPSSQARHRSGQRVSVAFQPSRHQATAHRPREWQGADHSSSYGQRDQQPTRDRGNYPGRQGLTRGRDSYERQQRQAPSRVQERDWFDGDRSTPAEPSNHSAQLPPGYSFNPRGASGNGKEAARHDPVLTSDTCAVSCAEQHST